MDGDAGDNAALTYTVEDATARLYFEVLSQGVRVFPWKVLGPGDDNSESINTLKVYRP